MIVKQVSPIHDQELGDLGESEYMYPDSIDYESNRIYSHQQVHQTSMTDNSYDVACYTPTPVNQISDCTNITAIRKSLMPGCHTISDSFENKHPDTWNQANLVQWIHRICELHDLDYQKLRYGLDSLTGSMLVKMPKAEVQERFPFGGAIVYDALQKFLHDIGFSEETSGYSSGYSQSIEPQEYLENIDALTYGLSGYNNCNLSLLNNVHHPGNQHHSNQLTSLTNGYYDGTTQRSEYLLHTSAIMMPHDNEKCTMDSEGESNHSFTVYHTDNYTVQPDSNSKIPGRRKPGRPPLKDKKGKNGGQRNSRLWEFIRDLLLDAKTCPSLLKWENVDEGVFRFVNSEKVARLWGERKCNPRMTYEKLSRAMRYYYKSQVFQPVIGRRLVYKFGPNATGWRPNPALVS
ncbi:hypothetical protein CHUAL_012844 [Chamberlinius hualienensis]